MFKNFFLFLFELVKIVVISLVIIIPVRYFLIQPFYVKGASMEPNFHNHEYLIIDEISFRFREPERGEIIVFRYPNDPRQFFIKRIIGKPNEKLEIKNGTVTVFNTDNPKGIILDESIYLSLGFNTIGERVILLGPDEYFVMGDNRNASLDSRSFGPINFDHMVGRAWIRGWPFNKIKVFEIPNYGN